MSVLLDILRYYTIKKMSRYRSDYMFKVDSKCIYDTVMCDSMIQILKHMFNAAINLSNYYI